MTIAEPLPPASPTGSLKNGDVRLGWGRDNVGGVGVCVLTVVVTAVFGVLDLV